MTGQEIQDKLDKIVADLQTTNKGFSTEIAFRQANGLLAVLPISADSAGIVDTAQLGAIQNVLNPIKAAADTYDTEYVSVKSASEAFSTARDAHQALIDQAKTARDNLSAALDADADYVNAKTAYDAAREAAAYIAARADYKDVNVSENYNNLSDARGNYVMIAP